jgi:uncharacterized membrane protein YkoI
MKTTLWLAPVCAVALAALTSCQQLNANDNENELEVKVPIEQVPAAARKTIEAQAQGGQITAVGKETENGKTIYEASVAINNQNYEIEVAEDGTLLEKELDDDVNDAEDDD